MAHPRAAFAHLNISNPLVAWLVYRGEIVSAGRAHEAVVSFWLMRGLSAEASMAHRGTRFRAELALEERRLANYPESVSRLRCFYAFDDASAQIAIRDWGPSFSRDNLAELGSPIA